MNIIKYPAREEWANIVERPHLDVTELNQTVANVLADVRVRGDEAVKGYELKFDHIDLDDSVSVQRRWRRSQVSSAGKKA